MLVRFKEEDAKNNIEKMIKFQNDKYPEYYFSHMSKNFACKNFYKYDFMHCDNHDDPTLSCIKYCAGFTCWIYFGKMKWKYIKTTDFGE